MTSSINRVVVAVPSGQFMTAATAVSLAHMFQHSASSLMGLINYQCSVLPQSRNQSVEIARKQNASHIFFIDSDIYFPPDSLKRLLAHKKDIVGGCYCTRNEERKFIGVPHFENDTTSLRRMKAIACGFVLIKMSVFDQLERPYFDFIYNPETDDYIDEGYRFCLLMQQKGVTMFEDQTLSRQLKHIGEKAYFRE